MNAITMEFSFHQIPMDNQNFQMSMYASGSSYEDGIIEYDLFYEEFGYQFFTADFTPDSYDCLRDKFIGNYRTEDNPVGVENGRLSGSSELGNNHCGALHKQILLQPGEEKRVIFLLGEGKRENGKKIREKYGNGAAVDHVYDQLKEYWDKKMNKLQIHTPDEGMNILINTWTLYQAEVNIMFSRFASFIEVGGRTGLGYRDTSQDSMTVPHSNPKKCRQRIVELLRGLVKEGYGLHLFQPEWFDPEEKGKKPFKSPTVVPTPKLTDMIHGIEDTCSDDALWLVASINEYVKKTGEFSFLDEIYTYADGGEGSVYEHMKRILSAKMQETDAVIGGESSGGLTVRGHINGKDGIYAASLLVEMIAVTGKKLSEIAKEIEGEYGEIHMVERDYRFTAQRKEQIHKILMEDKLLPKLPHAISNVSSARWTVS